MILQAAVSKDLLLYGGIALGAIILALIGYITSKKEKKTPKNNANMQ